MFILFNVYCIHGRTWFYNTPQDWRMPPDNGHDMAAAPDTESLHMLCILLIYSDLPPPKDIREKGTQGFVCTPVAH